MPNYCFNTLQIKGTRPELEKFKSGVMSKKTLLDFKRIISPSSHKQYTRKKWMLETTEERKKWGNFNQYWFNKGGYEWCVFNWGTKWNAFDIDLKEEEDVLKYRFVTAWSPPLQIIAEAINKYPNLEFIISYYEEGNRFGGTMTGKDGLVSEDERYNIICYFCKDCEYWWDVKEGEQCNVCPDCNSSNIEGE